MLRLIYIATAVLMLSLTFFGLWEKEVRGNHPFALPLDTYGPVDVSVSQTGNTFTFTWAGGQSNVWGSLFYGGESNNDDQIGRSVSSGITHDINTDGLWTFRILTTPSKSMVTFSNPLTLPAATLAATTDGFTASWTAYSGTSGYDVRWRPSSEGTWSTATVTTASYTATGLDTGTEYEFAYRLVSQHNVPTGSATRGRTDWSTNGTITTIVGPPDQMSISASPLDAHRVRVTWSPPHDGGAAITGYLLRYIPTGHGSVGSTWTQVEVSSGDTVYTLSGLSPGRRYGVQMLAKNSEGQRGWSESAFAQTQNAERSGPTLLPAGQEFPDDPDNPHFFHGATAYALLSILTGVCFAWWFRNPLAAGVGAIVPLLAAVPMGAFNPLLLLLLLLEGGAVAMAWMMMKR